MNATTCGSDTSRTSSRWPEEAEPELMRGDQTTWLARIEDEHDNIREALAFAVETRDASSALRVVVGIRRFWQIHGYLAEGRETIDAALALGPDTPSELRAHALNMAGILAGEQGDFDAARVSFNAALDNARAADSTRAISSALVNLGNLAFFGGDLDAARVLYRESIQHFESLGDLRGQALANENVGLMALTSDDIPEAVTWLTAALELARAGGDDREISAAARSLAAALMEVGKLDEAKAPAGGEPPGGARARGDARDRRLPGDVRRCRGDRGRRRPGRDALRRERRGAERDRRPAPAGQPDPVRALAGADACAPRYEGVFAAVRGRSRPPLGGRLCAGASPGGGSPAAGDLNGPLRVEIRKPTMRGINPCSNRARRPS
jgi:hypothetical protein